MRLRGWARVILGSRWTWGRRWEHTKNGLAGTAVVTGLARAADEWLNHIWPNSADTVLGWVLGIGIVVAVIAAILPVRTVARETVRADEEITIEVVVGDIRRKKTPKNALVIPTNIEGESMLEGRSSQVGRIRSSSVQGQYTQWMEDQGHGEEVHRKIQEWRKEHVDGRTPDEKENNRGKIIRIGRQAERAYWMVLGRLLSAGGTPITESEYLEGLSKGWEELGKVGGGENLVTPVIGAGQMKLPRSMTGLLRDMVHTFIEAQSKIRTCKRLTIVMRPEDLTGVKLNDISETVKMECRRYRRREQERQALGSEIGRKLT